MEPIGKPRTHLSRERVLTAAISLADADGIRRLTMRNLAQKLDVEAMSLYHYVANKGELLAAIVDRVASEFEVPGDGNWKRALSKAAMSAHYALLRHPWSAGLLLTSDVGDYRLRYMEGILRCLREAGFSPNLTHHAYHALESHVVGYTLWQVGMALDSKDIPSLATAFLSRLSRDEFPYFAEHVDQHLQDVHDDKTEFEFGLDLILDGLERLKGST